MTLLADTDSCMLRKLSKNYDECENHPEYDKGLRQQELDKHFGNVINALHTLDLKLDTSASNKALAAVYLLYKDFLTDGPWADEKYKEYAMRLDQELEQRYGVKVGDLLKTNHVFDNQGIFNEMMFQLHLKLTSKDFKRYPSLIKVYCSIFMKEIEEYNVIPKVMSLANSLYLIDDYILEHKKSGLICCINILHKLDKGAFADNNYYEVIYAALIKTFTNRETEITKLTIRALLELMGELVKTNVDFHKTKCEELLDTVLEQIEIESSLPRKAELFGFLTHLISVMGVNCVNRKSCLHVILNNLEISCQPGVDTIILLPVIEVLETWVRHCWCAWDQKTRVALIGSLLKVIYSCQNEDVSHQVINILAAIYHISPQNEKDQLKHNQAKLETVLGQRYDAFKEIVKW